MIGLMMLAVISNSGTSNTAVMGLLPAPDHASGPDLKGGNWAVAQGPPQLRGLHKKTVKNIT